MKKIFRFIICLVLIGGVILLAKRWVEDNSSILFGVKDDIPMQLETIPVKSFLFDSEDVLSEWQEQPLSSKKTTYNVAEYKGKKSVKAESDRSASSILIKETLSHKKMPFVSWDWIVEKFPDRSEPENITSKKEFDFAAQVYVAFHSLLYLDAKVIHYVWAKDLPVGQTAVSPYIGNIRIMVLESGIKENWVHEERNIREDYKKLFGKELKKDVFGVSFMTDADSTDSQAVAYFADLKMGYIKE
jgi:DUF3047 family protein